MSPQEMVARLPRGAQTRIARKYGKSTALVNSVIHRRPGNQSNNHKIRVAIARAMRPRLPVKVAFKDHDCKSNTILTKDGGAVNGNH